MRRRQRVPASETRVYTIELPSEGAAAGFVMVTVPEERAAEFEAALMASGPEDLVALLNGDLPIRVNQA